jgi:Domain of unknown function (DUF4401)
MTHELENAAWSRLRDAGLVAEGAPPPRDDTPWYLAGLVGVSAWVSAAFLFGFFVTLFDRLFDKGALAALVGVLCCVLALMLLRVARGRDFIEQFAIATSLAGQVLIGVGVSDVIRDAGGQELRRATWAIVAAVACAMYARGTQPMHRFLCGGIAGIALACLCNTNGLHTSGALALPLVAWSAGFAWWFTADRHRHALSLVPLAWALTLVAIGLAWWDDKRQLIGPGFITLHPWRIAADLAMALLLPACTAWLLTRRTPPLPLARRAIVIGIAAALALLWFRAPGLSLGVAVAMVGFAVRRPALLAVGAIGLTLYLPYYYHQIDIPLLQKSYWLLGGGIALLLVRAAYLRFLREEAV